MEYCSVIGKDEIFPFTTRGMDLGNNMLSEISQKKLRTIFHTYVGYKTETHRHRQQYGGCRGKGVGVVKGKGDQIYDDRRWFDCGW